MKIKKENKMEYIEEIKKLSKAYQVIWEQVNEGKISKEIYEVLVNAIDYRKLEISKYLKGE